MTIPPTRDPFSAPEAGQPVPGPLSRPADTFSGKAVAALYTMIVGGRLRLGERLNEVELAEALGISRGPLREAIHHLRSKGILTGVPGRGTFVRSVTPAQLRDLFAVRRLVECHALRLTVARGAGAEIAAFREDVVERGHLMAIYPDAPEGEDFHLRLASLSGNQALADVVTDVHRQTQLVRGRIATSNLDRPERIVQEHVAVLDALAAGDAERAAQMLTEHLQTTQEEGVAFLDQAAAEG